MTFIVNDAQMQVLLAFERQKFIDDMVGLLWRDQPELLEEIPATEVREQVSALINRAEQIGFHIYTDVVQFIILALSLGLDFETQPEYAEICNLLNESDIDPSIRLTRVRHLLETDEDDLYEP